MGYSERSLRRLVDKIHDGSVNTVEYVGNSALHRFNISSIVGQSGNHDNEADEYLDSIFIQQDDRNTSPASATEPLSTIDQLYASTGQGHLPDSMNEEIASNNDDFSLAEICAYQLISFLDDAKAPRNCYDGLIALLKRQQKMGFSITEAIGRDTFLKSLKKKFKSPSVSSVTVGTSPVFKFPFVHMLQNLLDVVGSDLHLINPNSICSTGSSDELWNTKWMINTFRYGHRDFSVERDIMLPVIIYMDKTGTDAYQRYSLEPVIFSLGNIPREKRDSRRSWRHLGFVPSNKHIEKALPKLQFYHDCLQVILQELIVAQREHPKVKIKQPDGLVYEFQARLPIVLVMGDQLSQDTLCARLKVNAGGASRIHRSCMCSYLSVDDPSMTCMSVSKHTLDEMTHLSLLSDTQIAAITDGDRIEEDFFKKLRLMNQRFLAKPYGTYPVRNAFDGADFGSWTEGIYDASLDDFMHSTELGVIKTLNEVVFQGLTKSECTQVEYLMQTFMSGVRSSVRSTYPRWRLSDGFSRQKLMTSTERVGTLFSLCLAFQSHEIQDIIAVAHARQRQKYNTFSEDAGINDVRENPDTNTIDADENSPSEVDDSEDDFSDHLDDDESLVQDIMNRNTQEGTQLQDRKFFFEAHFQCNITQEQIKHALEHSLRHGFDLEQLKSFDLLQMNQFVNQAHLLFRKQKHSYPRRTIAGYFNLEADFNVPLDILEMAIKSVQTRPDDILHEHRFYGIESVLLKHFKEKKRIKGAGRTAAILNHDMHAVTLFLEYVLCFHAFCKYSSALPSSVRDNFANVHHGGRSLVRYIERQFYRGDDTVDYRTTKLHCHRRIGRNYEEMRSLMHFSTEVGERMMKTEAKQISRTAQQRGEVTFEAQTSERVLERQLLETFGDVVENLLQPPLKNAREKKDAFTRNLPHFVFTREDTTVLAMDRHGKTSLPNNRTGNIPSIIKKTLLQHESTMSSFEIYNEAILRDDSYIRAFPMYRNESPFYDFVQVQWEDSSHPAKVVCFYKRPHHGLGAEEDGLCALVHVVDEKTFGKVRGYSNTFLSTHYNLKYERGQPTLYSVPLASIDYAILAFPHEAQGATLFNPNKRGVCVVRPRNEWSYVWMAWNDILLEENSLAAHESRKRREDRRYVSFNGRQTIRKVQNKLQDYLSVEHD
jgi:Plavaka transposase